MTRLNLMLVCFIVVLLGIIGVMYHRDSTQQELVLDKLDLCSEFCSPLEPISSSNDMCVCFAPAGIASVKILCTAWSPSNADYCERRYQEFMTSWCNENPNANNTCDELPFQ